MKKEKEEMKYQKQQEREGDDKEEGKEIKMWMYGMQRKVGNEEREKQKR